MKRHMKGKQFELLHNTLGIMAAELADVEDSFHQGKQCSAHAQMQSSQIWVSSFSLQISTSESANVSFFSPPCGLSIGVTHAINLKIEKFDIFTFTSKHMDKKQKSPEIVLTVAPNQFELSTLECIFVPNFAVLSHLEQLE